MIRMKNPSAFGHKIVRVEGPMQCREMSNGCMPRGAGAGSPSAWNLCVNSSRCISFY
uniref:Uncharacterized protein n=1 Tax=Oryza punctata TaxID=4537 RepID=A0A0E0KMR9_ORYPU